MAIVKMKKLRLFGLREERGDLFRDLQLLGCVEVRDAECDVTAADAAGTFKRYTPSRTEHATRAARLQSAINALDVYAPCKTKMLAPKPSVERERFFDAEAFEDAADTADKINDLLTEINSAKAEISRLNGEIAALKPWTGTEIPLETASTRKTDVFFGTLPPNVDFAAAAGEIENDAELCSLSLVSADKNALYIVLIAHRDAEDAALGAARKLGFNRVLFTDKRGLAEDNIDRYELTAARLAEDIAAKEEQIAACADMRDTLKIAYDRATAGVERRDTEENIFASERVFAMTGWFPAEAEEKLTEVLADYTCAVETSEPEEDEYPDVPVKLKNNRLTDGLNMVTNMYSLPQYGTVDPNPLMAPFFILFFGIMMADMGYGLIMMIAGLVILRKMRPEEGFLRYFGELMVEGGAATFIMGVLSGGLFGDAPKQIVHILNPASTWQGLPALIDPLNDTVTVLIGAMILGFIHVNAGLVVSFVMKAKKGDIADAIFNEGAMWVIFAGAACAILKIGMVAGQPILLYAALLFYAYGKSRGAKGIGKLTAVFSGVYSDVTGWFGDVLSYSRLMALMLAGSVIAQVFNTLGAMPGSIIVFIPIFLIGNTLNFGLNLLGCYVHDLRLQCLEFFNKFYVDGGKPFKPLAIRSKYYKVK